MSDLNWRKVERLFRIQALLQSKPYSIKELAWLLYQEDIESKRIDAESAQRNLRRDFEFLLREDLHLGIETVTSLSLKRYTIPNKTTLDKNQILAVYSLLRLFEHHAPVNDELYNRMATTLLGNLPEHIKKTFGRCAKIKKTARPQPLSRNLEFINQAWVKQTQIAFEYRKAGGSGQWRKNRLSIGLVELSRTNLDHYIIGFEHDFHKGVRTFKLSRMRAIELLEQPAEIPSDFDPRKYLENAWGVVGNSDGDSLEIVLRYSPRAVERLEEGGYANLTMLEQYDDGSRKVLLKAGTNKEGVPIEVMSHIRSWGILVEVLEPPFLREMWLQEARDLLELYERGGKV
jgi:predicted DNA-binding transcriptional regulator YafY